MLRKLSLVSCCVVVWMLFSFFVNLVYYVIQHKKTVKNVDKVMY